MPGFNAAVVALPPFLADLVRFVLVDRTDIAAVVEIAASPRLVERLQGLDPSLVIIGAADADDMRIPAAVAAALTRARVVTLSSDGRYILGPGGKRELTVGRLAGLVR